MNRIFFGPALLLLIAVLTACGTIKSYLGVTTESPVEYIVYTVNQGDTLSQIATRHHVTIEELITLNSSRYPSLARDPSSLKPGWQLRVPKSTAPATEVPRTDLKQVAKLIIDSINNERAQKGMSLLRSDVILTRIATNRSDDLIARDYFSHYDPQTGQQPFLRYLQAENFAYRFAGENIAEVKNDSGWVPAWMTVASRYTAVDLSSQFVTGWLNSPDHRANIFNGNYRRTGVALSVSADGRRIVATQVFSD